MQHSPRIETILIDMDGIMIIDMLQQWLDKYYKLSGDRVNASDVVTWSVDDFIERPDLLSKVLEKPLFHKELLPTSSFVSVFKKLMKLDLDIIVLTQPARRADFSVRDKRDWMKELFPKFELSNMIFAHRKEMIDGDVLFDDNPEHLRKWKKRHPKGITATIEHPYNIDAPVDWRFTNHKKAWKEFYEAIKNHTNFTLFGNFDF